jgi:hypothetical protein
MIERKYLAHYIDTSFGGAVANYRLGKDVDEYNIELNPEVEKKKNIIGENSVVLSGYEPQSGLDTYYGSYDEALTTKLLQIANERTTGDGVRTTVVDVLLKEVNGVVSVIWAYREEVVIAVNSVGGGNSGVNIPFDIHYAGNRTSGTWNIAAKSFVPTAGTLGRLQIEVIKGGTITTTKVSDVIGEPAGSTLYYKVGTGLTAPAYGDASTGYTALTTGTAITTAAGQSIVVVAVNTTIVAASDIVPVVVGA